MAFGEWAPMAGGSKTPATCNLWSSFLTGRPTAKKSGSERTLAGDFRRETSFQYLAATQKAGLFPFEGVFYFGRRRFGLGL